MAITREKEQEPGATYTPEQDVYETLADGRTTLKAAAGVALPVTEAERLGLTKPTKSAGPSETKTETDAEAKAAAAAAKKAAAEGAAKNKAAEEAQHNQPAGAERAPAAESKG